MEKMNNHAFELSFKKQKAVKHAMALTSPSGVTYIPKKHNGDHMLRKWNMG